MNRCLFLIVLGSVLLSGNGECSNPKKVFHYNQWTVLINKGSVRISADGAQVASVGYWPSFKVIETTAEANDIRFTGKQRERQVDATFQFRDGKLLCQWKAGPLKSAYRFFVMVTFAGGDLASSDVVMDGKRVRVPPALVKHEFPHARRYVFFQDRPVKRLAVDFSKCNFSNLRDFRRGGRTDLQIFAIADDRGLIEATFDLTQSTTFNQQERYEGEQFVRLDDLHLPDLTQTRNGVQNPGFEAGLALWGWGVTGVRPSPDPTRGWSEGPAEAHSGRKSARYTVARGYNPKMLCTYPIAVKTGQTYTASFYAKTDRPGVGLSVFIHTAKWADFPAKGGKRLLPEKEWKRFEVTFEAPNPFLRLCFGDRWWDHRREDQIDGARIWLDDVQLEEGNAATPFVQKPLMVFSTTGTRDESISLGAQERKVTVTLVNTSPKPERCRVNVSVQDLARKPLLTRKLEGAVPPWGQLKREIDLAGLTERGLLRVLMDASNSAFRETFYGRVFLYQTITAPPKVRYAWHMEPTVDQGRRLKRYGVYGSLSFRIPAEPGLCSGLNEIDWVHVFSPTHDRKSPIKLFKQKMTESDWETYEKWVAARIAPYGDQMYWKTLNEPNCSGYTWTPAECARAVGIMRKYIKAINPSAKILTPDPYNASRSGRAWMEAFFRAGGDKLVDVVAIHTYRARPESPDLDYDLAQVASLKERFGLASAPIMLTEGEGTPIYTVPEISMSPFSGFNEWRLSLLGLDVGRSEIASAGLMTRTLLACLKNSPPVTFYLTWRNDVFQSQPLASLAALNHLFSLLGQANFMREYQIGETTKTYLFETSSKRPVAVLWSHDLKVDRDETPAPKAKLPILDGDWQLLDLMGNPITPRREGGRWVFPVSGLPTYIVGPPGGSKGLMKSLEGASIGESGLRSVTTRLRLSGASQAALVIANRLIRPVTGHLRVVMSEAKPFEKELTLDRKQSAVLPIALPQGAPGINASTAKMTFVESNGNVVQRTEQLRWFAIPRLRRQVTIDGDISDWEMHEQFALDKAGVLSFRKNDKLKGPADLSATCRFGFDERGLSFCIEVRDDVFSQANPIETAWRGDSLQIYIDLMADGRDNPGVGYDSNDQSIYVAKIGGKDLLYRDYSPEFQIAFVKSGLIRDGKCAIRRRGDVTTYEVMLPAKELFPLKMQAGTSFGFGLIVNDADADQKRRQGLSNTPPGAELHGRPDRWPAAVLVDAHFRNKIRGKERQ